MAAQTALGATLPASTAARKFSSWVSTSKRHLLQPTRHTLNPVSSSRIIPSAAAATSSRPGSPVEALRAQPLVEPGTSKQHGPHTPSTYCSSSRSSSSTELSAASAAGAPGAHQAQSSDAPAGLEGVWNGLLKLLIETVVDPKDADAASTTAESADAQGDCAGNSGWVNGESAVPGHGHGHVGSRAQRCASSRGSSLQYLFGTLLFASGLFLSMHDPALAAEAAQEASSPLAGAGAAAALAAGVPGDAVGSTWDLAFVPGMPGAEGPFWDNVLRFMVYFVTVFTGGLYTLVKPVYDLAKNPVTLVLLILVVGGGFSFLYFALSAMLGLNDPVYSL